MNPFEKEAHKTKRQKMGCVSGSPANFESGADKASRFCRGGYADGGSVVRDNDQASFERMNAARDQPTPTPSPAPQSDYATDWANAKKIMGK